MAELIAYLTCFIFLALSLFQIALAFGAPLGHFAWGGAHKVLPAKLRIGSMVSVILYGIFSIFMLDKVGLINIMANEAIVTTGMWAITAYLGLGIIMNAISRSKSERLTMTPVVLVLALLFLAASLGVS